MTQADNTTTTVLAEKPTQQATNNNAENLAKAKAADARQPIILEGENIYGEFEKFGSEPGRYKEGSPIQGEFWRYRFRGVVVTVSPETHKALSDGTITKVVATPTVGERFVPDPMNAGQMKQDIVYGYSITASGAEALQKALNAKRIAAKLKMEIAVQEKKQEMMVEATLAHLTPEKIAASIKPEDIEALLAAEFGA